MWIKNGRNPRAGAAANGHGACWQRELLRSLGLVGAVGCDEYDRRADLGNQVARNLGPDGPFSRVLAGVAGYDASQPLSDGFVAYAGAYKIHVHTFLQIQSALSSTCANKARDSPGRTGPLPCRIGAVNKQKPPLWEGV